MPNEQTGSQPAAPAQGAQEPAAGPAIQDIDLQALARRIAALLREELRIERERRRGAN